MLSRAEMRLWLERALRGIVIAILALMLWQSFYQQTDSGGRVVRARGVDRTSLGEWSASPRPASGIHLQLDSVPSPLERAWLGALAGAGSSVTWRGDVPPLMIDAQPIASPTGGTKILVAAPNGSAVMLRDRVGAIDTLRQRNGGVSLVLTSVQDSLTARVNGSVASTVLRDSAMLRKVLVIGAAGWESKFIVAALEEEGWKMDALVRVAPSVEVAQGTPTTIDTSRYSAVVALDRTASPYMRRIVEFVKAGGGVVLAPEAASLEGLADVRAGTVGEEGAKSAARTIPNAGSITSANLAYTPIRSLRGDAAAIEKRADGVVIAARRTGAGRVIQLGYEDTWRWRMRGGADAVRQYRLWWTRLASSVAYGPRLPRAQSVGSDHQTNQDDEAPLAGLVAAIGPSTSTARLTSLSYGSSSSLEILFALLAMGLFGEVLSRRVRGAA